MLTVPNSVRIGAAIGVVFGLAAASGLVICDLLFGCGCEALWAGGAAHCDVTVAGPPDCPFCAGSLARSLALRGGVATAIVGTMVPYGRRGGTGPRLIVAGFLAFLTASVAAGAILAAVDGNERFGAFLRDVGPPQHPQAR